MTIITRIYGKDYHYWMFSSGSLVIYDITGIHKVDLVD